MAKYAVVTAKETGAPVATSTIVDGAKKRESKNTQLFDDLNDARAHAVALNVATRNVLRDAITNARKMKAHNIANDEPAGQNLQGESWESMLGTQGSRS
jgi:hypothetical protein